MYISQKNANILRWKMQIKTTIKLSMQLAKMEKMENINGEDAEQLSYFTMGV